jgi:hypothetical protein
MNAINNNGSANQIKQPNEDVLFSTASSGPSPTTWANGDTTADLGSDVGIFPPGIYIFSFVEKTNI